MGSVRKENESINLQIIESEKQVKMEEQYRDQLLLECASLIAGLRRKEKEKKAQINDRYQFYFDSLTKNSFCRIEEFSPKQKKILLKQSNIEIERYKLRNRNNLNVC